MIEELNRETKVIKQKIREVELSFRKLFSEKKEFNENLSKWQDTELYDMHDFNSFIPAEKGRAGLTFSDFEEAVKYQRDRGWNFIKFESRKPLDEELAKKLKTVYKMEGWQTDTLYLPKGCHECWKRNSLVEIFDVKEADIAQALEEIELVNYGKNTGEDFTKRKIAHYIKKAREHDNFHYFGVFLNGKIAGAGYACVNDGYIQIDNLIVNEEMRKKYIATTLMLYIAEHFDGILFLHADPEDTPKEMYLKMGFEVIDSINEYCAVWSPEKEWEI